MKKEIKTKEDVKMLETKTAVTPEAIEINLDLKIDNRQIIELMQGYNYTLNFNVFDNSDIIDLEGTIAQLHLKKSDQKYIIQTSGIKIKNNTVTVELDGDFTRIDGLAKLQLIITSGGKKFGSWVVDANVKKQVITDTDIKSEDKVTITEELTEAIKKGQEAVRESEEAKNKLDQSIKAGELENYVRTFNTFEDMNKAIEGLKEGQELKTKGYHKKNDGGGAEYIKQGGKINLVIKNRINVKVFGAKGDGTTDDADAIIKAMNVANGTDRGEQVNLYFPKGMYRIGRKVTPPANTTLRLVGETKGSSYLKPIDGFSDTCLFELAKESKSIYLKDIAFTGNSNRKISAIEINAGSHGQLFIENVNCSGFRYFIRGGKTAEFPLGGTFKDIYCLDNFVGGIMLATEGSPKSGQSCFTFDNVIVTSPNTAVIEYANFSKSTSGRNDTITVNGIESMEDFGAMIMRKQQGQTEWKHCGWVKKSDQEGKTFSIPNEGNNYDYKLIENTCGVYLKHLKAVNVGVIQAEYVGIGAFFDTCRAIVINSFYNEYRNRSTTLPKPQGYGIYSVSCESFSLDSAWIENTYQGLYAYNCNYVGIDSIIGNVIDSVIYSHQINNKQFIKINKIIKKGATGTELKHGDGAQKYYELNNIATGDITTKSISGLSGSELSLEYRGNKKGLIKADSKGLIIESNKFNNNISSVTTIKPALTSTYFKTIKNNAPTEIIKFKPTNNYSLSFRYVIRATSGVTRQYISGMCNIDAFFSENWRAKINNIEYNKDEQAGTITTPSFTTNRAGDGTYTISVQVNSSNCTDVKISVVPVMAIGNEIVSISIL